MPSSFLLLKAKENYLFFSLSLLVAFLVILMVFPRDSPAALNGLETCSLLSSCPSSLLRSSELLMDFGAIHF